MQVGESIIMNNGNIMPKMKRVFGARGGFLLISSKSFGNQRLEYTYAPRN